jgi:hypothetical protein
MKRITMLALALGISILGLQTRTSAADPSCATQCNNNYKQCQKVCSVNPCIVSCDTSLQSCMSSCPTG